LKKDQLTKVERGKKMGVKKRVVCLVIAAVAVLVMSGCSFTGGGGLSDRGCFMKLSIEPGTSAKSISVSEIEVTGLTVEIYDSAGDLAESIEWDPTDGAQEYLLAFSDPGDYELMVTHRGDGAEVTETESFALKIMKITMITIVPGQIGVVSIDGGGGDTPSFSEWLLGTWGGSEDAGDMGTLYHEVIFEGDGSWASLYYDSVGELVGDVTGRGSYEIDGNQLTLVFEEMYWDGTWHTVASPWESVVELDESLLEGDEIVMEIDQNDDGVIDFTISLVRQ
jgi:hypothetical protein